MNERTEKLLRTGLVAAGAVLIALALVSDIIGLSAGDGFSRNQCIITALGVVSIVAGLLGRRLPGVYRGAGLILLNSILVFLVFELLSLVAIKIWNPYSISIRRLKEEVAGDLTAREVTIVSGHYVSYLVWCADSLMQGVQSTDERGFRITPGAVDGADSYDIYMFGGSAMWGERVPDSCTIACYLQTCLQESMNCPVCVHNYGQESWVSSQELLCLFMELREGRSPDLVVFFDGFNDVWSSFQIGRAGEHQNFPQIRDRVEGRDIRRVQESLLPQLLSRTNIAQLLQLVRTGGTLRPEPEELVTYNTMGVDAQILAESTFAVYRRNMRMASSLGDEFGFDCLFFWQPCIWCGNKPRSSYEDLVWQSGTEAFVAGGDPAWKDLIRRTQNTASLYSSSLEHFVDLSTAFDSSTAEYYSDYSGCHLNPDGNAFIASRIADVIVDTIDPALLNSR